MSEDERVVRETWGWVAVRQSTDSDEWTTLYSIHFGPNEYRAAHCTEPSSPLSKAWSAAAEFTRARLEEARQIEREIVIVSRIAEWYSNESVRSMRMGLPNSAGGEVRDECSARRAVSRLTTERDRLKQGFKEHGNG